MQEILSKKNIGNRIKFIRQKNGHSQDFIAKSLNISRSNYSQIEIGNQYPSYETLHLIARFYSVSYNWILHGFDSADWNAESVPINKKLRKPVVAEDIGDNSKVTLVTNNTYTTQLYDQSYINSLSRMDLPVSFINKEFVHRAFALEKTTSNNEVLIGRSINSFDDIKAGSLYIIVTTDQLFNCTITDVIAENETLVCKSRTSPIFTVGMDKIQEVWLVVGQLSEIINTVAEDLKENIDRFKNMISELEKKVQLLANSKTKR